ncbi:MAG: SGNH/GDSL hydrolase family protein [Pirellulales bacterium]|nr:SGNH/GDSL hydrolase family protein [Pirellulales bacterium]
MMHQPTPLPFAVRSRILSACLALMISIIGAVWSPAIKAVAAEPDLKPGAILLFLGDSNTFSGDYVAMLQTCLKIRHPDNTWQFINHGLPSEGVTGLTERDHPFPRPNVHERLERALQKIKPDVVFACYGMNDGIYWPPGKDRQRAYEQGMEQLIHVVQQSGAKLILMTPPPFTGQELPSALPAGAADYGYKTPYRDYDQVLQGYSTWLQNRARPDLPVVDLHQSLTRAWREARQKKATVNLAGDGIHFDSAGHWLVAENVLETLRIVPLTTRVEYDASRREVAQPDNAPRATMPADLDIQHTGPALRILYTAHPPFPQETTWSKELVPVARAARWNAQIIKITGLEPGKYNLCWNEQILSMVTHEELAAGINLDTYLDTPRQQTARELLKICRQSSELQKLAWLSEVGHQRPGIAAGLSLSEMREKCQSLTVEMNKLCQPGKIDLLIQPAKN